MTENTDLYAACPSCMSLSSQDTRETATETAERHNNASHDGNSLANSVNMRDADELAEFLEHASKHATGEEYENFIKRMYNGNTPFFCSAELYRKAVPNEDK